MDVLGVAVGEEFLLGQLGVALDLMDGGDDTGVLDDGLDLVKGQRERLLHAMKGEPRISLTCSAVKFETPMVLTLDLGSFVMAVKKPIVSANAIYAGVFRGFQFVHIPFQVSEMETPLSSATSSLLSDSVGKRASPVGKATGQWMR